MTREPAVIIGVIVAIIVAVAVQLTDNGLVSSEQGKNLLHFLAVIAPIIGAALTRLFVTPTAAPVLPTGTVVTTPDNTRATVVGG